MTQTTTTKTREAKMSQYKISTDSEMQTIEASDIDAAAAAFSRRYTTMAALVDAVVDAGGWITVTEDGEQVVYAGDR